MLRRSSVLLDLGLVCSFCVVTAICGKRLSSFIIIIAFVADIAIIVVIVIVVIVIVVVIVVVEVIVVIMFEDLLCSEFEGSPRRRMECSFPA